MEMLRATTYMRWRRVVAFVIAVGVVTTTVVLLSLRAPCPGDPAATRVELGRSADAGIDVDGHSYRVSASALLDYMPRSYPVPPSYSGPLKSQAVRHPLQIIATISAGSISDLGEPIVTCFRATRGTDVWSGRATTHGIQTAADGYPPGAPSPVPNRAWRLATSSDGPEWSESDSVTIEIWATIRGRPYVFVLTEPSLMKGG